MSHDTRSNLLDNLVGFIHATDEGILPELLLPVLEPLGGVTTVTSRLILQPMIPIITGAKLFSV